jgi:hypothetical protein
VNIPTRDPDENPVPVAKQSRLLSRTRLTLFQVACLPRRARLRQKRRLLHSRGGVHKGISGLRLVRLSCSDGGSVLP